MNIGNIEKNLSSINLDQTSEEKKMLRFPYDYADELSAKEAKNNIKSVRKIINKVILHIFVLGSPLLILFYLIERKLG
jgi:hypothetical protein